MNFILNERSLHGQFKTMEEFLRSLESNLHCFRLVRCQKDGEIRKIADFYKCQVTENQKLGDLKEYPRSDALSRLRIALDKEMRTEPYWDLSPAHDYGMPYWMGKEDVAATAVAEAVERKESLLSFQSAIYSDTQLSIKWNGGEYYVASIYHMDRNFYKWPPVIPQSTRRPGTSHPAEDHISYNTAAGLRIPSG